MLKNEFEEIIDLLEVKKMQSVTSLQEILKKVSKFFQKLNQELLQANKEEKEEIYQMLSSLQKKLQDKIQEFCHQSGVTEDQIYQLSQDVSKLPEEQKELILEPKKEIADASKKIRHHLAEKYADTSIKKENTSASTEKKKHRRNKGDWTKS